MWIKEATAGKLRGKFKRLREYRRSTASRNEMNKYKKKKKKKERNENVKDYERHACIEFYTRYKRETLTWKDKGGI